MPRFTIEMTDGAVDPHSFIGGDRQTFVSERHPGSRSYAVVFGRHSVNAIAVAFLPLMVASLIAALQYEPILGFLLWGFPVALVGALLWTAFSLRRQVCQIDILGNTVRLSSIHDVARGADAARYVVLFDVRDYGSWLSIAAGDADYFALRDEWPNYRKLREALNGAIFRYGH